MDSKRKTIQRQLILDAVKELDIHSTAEQVYEHVVKQHPSISRATVYRNLGQMAETGELINIGNFYGAAHYDHNLHHHYHVICEECKRIFDVEGDFSDIGKRIKGVKGFVITTCNISFKGLCPDCKMEKKMS